MCVILLEIIMEYMKVCVVDDKKKIIFYKRKKKLNK